MEYYNIGELMTKIEEFFRKSLIEKKSTQKTYKVQIMKYFEVIKQDINTYFDNKQPYEEHIRLYWEYLQNKSPKYRGTSISAIKSFLARFDKSTKTLDIWDDIHARLKRKVKPIHEKHVPDIDEVRQILHYADMRTKTSVMIALTSGMRISEVVNLLPNDIYLNEIPTRINIRPEIAKNGQRRTTFISKEATNLLNEWLRIRERYLAESLKSMNFKNRSYVKTRKDDRIFPYSSGSIRTGFNTSCEKAGFTDKTIMKGDFDFKIRKKDNKMLERNRRHLTFHNLRDFFRTYLGNVDLSEHLMGHTGYLSTYRQYNDKQLAKLYMEYEKNVTVFERSPDLSKVNSKIIKLEEENEQLRKDLDRILRSTLINKLLEENQIKP